MLIFTIARITSALQNKNDFKFNIIARFPMRITHEFQARETPYQALYALEALRFLPHIRSEKIPSKLRQSFDFT